MAAKNIALTSDEDITPVLREIVIVKLSKKVKSTDVLKVLHFNDTSTSLVEVPCFAKRSGFKKQAQRTRWVHRILECVRRCKRENALVDDNDDDEDDGNKIAHTDDDAARWLMAECLSRRSLS